MDRQIPREQVLREKRKKLLKALIIVSVVVGVFLTLLFSVEKSIKREYITLGGAHVGALETSVTASGTVKPAYEQIVTSPISSTIVEVYHREGDVVEAGTPLLRLDLQSSESDLNRLKDQLRMKAFEVEQGSLNDRTYLNNLRMQISVKQMAVNRLKAEVANQQRLDSIGSGTGDQVMEARLAYDTGLLELKQLREQLTNETAARQAADASRRLDLSICERNVSEMERTLTDARVLAPISAAVTYVNTELGAQVSPGQKIAAVADLSHYKLEGTVAETYASKVVPGAVAILKIGKNMLEGHVSSVTPESKDGQVRFTVQIDDDNHPALRSGIQTEVYVKGVRRDSALIIPNGPYYAFGPGTYDLFVKDGDGHLVKRKVTLGDSNYESVEVKSGLVPGDSVVTSDMSDYRKNNTLKIK